MHCDPVISHGFCVTNFTKIPITIPRFNREGSLILFFTISGVRMSRAVVTASERSREKPI
jgi:hypothetical protein